MPAPGAAQTDKRAALLNHDIRNAVGDILGGLALADLSSLDAASQQQLTRVRSAGEQLGRLCDEMMHLFCGEGRSEAPAPLKLGTFLDEIAARWAAHARERGLDFEVERGSDLPAAIGTDRGALERILANLIGNAIKHTDSGDVVLGVGMRTRETLSLTVRDSGPGFSDAALAHLFEAGGRPAESDTPGDGLGLHIVHELVGGIGGRMEVRNRSLGGAEVTVHLPRAAWAPGRSGDADVALPDLSGFRVLVAEDNETSQLLLRQMLDTLGARAWFASDGEAALELLGARQFDLALMDIEMPRLSGLDLIRALRRREADAGTRTPLPVLAITAFVLNANRNQIYDAGADGILAKPILSLEAFGEAIAAVLNRQRTADAVPPGDAGSFDRLHLDRLLALAGDAHGHELMTRLLQDFRTARDGIRTGLDEHDFALLRARTHVLIALAGAVGAERLQSLAEALNAATHSRDGTVTGRLGPRIIREVGHVLSCLDGEFADRIAAGAA